MAYDGAKTATFPGDASMSAWTCSRRASVFARLRSVYFVVTFFATTTGRRIAAKGDAYATDVVRVCGNARMLAYMLGG